MRILVCGGRNYDDAQKVATILDVLEPTVVISGGCTGADALASTWATKHKIPVIVELANFKLYGKAAGPIRNQRMLDDHNPELVVAFPGGHGTADMVARARKEKVQVMIV